MSACDIDVRSDFTVRTSNPLQIIATKVEGMVGDAVDDQREQIVRLRKAIEDLRGIHKRPLHPGLDLPENILWNFLLDKLQDSLGGLEDNIDDLEQTITSVGNELRAILEGVGNPGTLTDIAVLIREGVADRATALAKEVSLTKLSVDNEWSSSAADAYTERAQAQVDEGLARVAAAGVALADFLDTHAETEVSFWESMVELAVNVIVFLVGVMFTAAGLASMALGLAAAIPTGGIALIGTALGIISTIGGIIITAISGWLLFQSFENSIEDADSALAEGIEALNAAAIPAGSSWPVLAS